MDDATPFLRRLRGLLLLPLLLLATLPASAQDVIIGGDLAGTLANALPTDELEVIVTFDQEGPLGATELDALNALGLEGYTFQSLPMAAVVATPSQVDALADLAGVVSVYPNEALTYSNKRSRDITGVDKARDEREFQRLNGGLPFSGAGVGVLVIDSGVDGTLEDLKFGENLVQNVYGATNPKGVLQDDTFPVNYTENVINTDLGGSGHGTHVAGTVGGTGESSAGKYAGVANGADLIGYGGGAGLFVVGALGGFDYAITNQQRYNIRVITNSYGSSGDPDPNSPLNIATKEAYDKGMTVVFAAGNDGAEDTINPYCTPYVICVGAGDKDGNIASFSSLGQEDDTSTYTTHDGDTFMLTNEPDVIGPGVDVISARTAVNIFTPLDAEADAEQIEPGFLPYYTLSSGTSMSTPHVSGIVALIAEANPALLPDEVKDILKRSAANMPGYPSWMIGAGYVNAYAALTEALGFRDDFGATLNLNRTFNANAQITPAGTEDFVVNYDPIQEFDAYEFEVAEDVGRLRASGSVATDPLLGEAANTVAVVLRSPSGETFSSGLALPVLGTARFVVLVDNPEPGTWEVTAGGIGVVSGQDVDPLGLTNGLALPEQIEGTIEYFRNDGFSGLDDIAGHPAESAIQFAAVERLVDSDANGRFRPDAKLTRGDLAEWLVMGAGIRQSLPLDGGFSFGDVSDDLAPYAEAVAAPGAALRDRTQRQAPVVVADGGFQPNGKVDRVDLAYAFVQSLALQEVAEGFEGETVFATFGTDRIAVEDSGAIPADLRGHVQLALDLGLLNAYFELTQGPFDLTPTIKARFRPDERVTRAAYAVAASRYLAVYPLLSPDSYEPGTADGGDAASRTEDQPTTYALEQNYPNPFADATRIAFAMPQGGDVTLTVYDVLGRRVATLADRAYEAGEYTVEFDARDFAAGTYVYRLETPAGTQTRQMTVVR